jgi:hypothetical protein
MTAISMVTFAPSTNTPPKHDATGAFLPEQRAFAKLWAGRGHAVESAVFDNTRPVEKRRATVLDALRDRTRLRCVAFLCHGLRRSIQAGFAIAHIPELGAALSSALAPGGVVALYACDTARDDDREQEDDLQPGPGGEGGFADLLSDAIVSHRLVTDGADWSGWIDAHPLSGHTTSNAFVRRFRGRADGGTWIVSPKSSRWKEWKRRLRDPHDALRLAYPLMHEDEIHADLDLTRR